MRYCRQAQGRVKMKVSFYTLGCKVNQYETQSMREQFLAAGYEIAEEEEGADVCVINTCSVTNAADRKSRQYIRRMKHLNPNAVIAVTGCYAQTDPEAVSEIEGVNIIAGTNEKSNIVGFISDYLSRNDAEKTAGADHEKPDTHILSYGELDHYEDMKMITAMESRSRAFIKIEEGCDRFCTYCIIPYARGPVRSRSVESVVREAGKLIEGGYHEIVLTGINTALYGRDLTGTDNSEGLLRLLDEIVAMKGDFRIRLSSLEPNVIDRETALKLIRYDRLCSHMHLSVQSGSDTVLRRMGRRYDIRQYQAIAEALRSLDPDYGITTDIIAGFPGETEQEFEETLETVRRIRFSKIHVFKYSRRDHTRAAAMPGQVDGKIKNQRAEILSRESDRQAEEFYQQNSGKSRRVLFEQLTADGNYLEGYTDNYIKVYVPFSEERKGFLYDFAEIRLKDPFRDGMTGLFV